MIPVLIGAAVVGAGAVLLSGDEPEHTEPEHTRHRVSENTVQRAMARSGRKIHTVSQNFGSSQIRNDSSFGSDFERIENMFANPNVNRITIKNELESIRWRAKNRGNEVALNFVDYYLNKLRNR